MLLPSEGTCYHLAGSHVEHDVFCRTQTCLSVSLRESRMVGWFCGAAKPISPLGRTSYVRGWPY